MSEVRIYEVTPRDGLQNEARFLTPSERVDLIELLAQSGLQQIIHP